MNVLFSANWLGSRHAMECNCANIFMLPETICTEPEYISYCYKKYFSCYVETLEWEKLNLNRIYYSSNITLIHNMVCLPLAYHDWTEHISSVVHKPNFMLSTLCEWILKSTHQSLKQWFNIWEPAYKFNVYKTSEVR